MKTALSRLSDRELIEKIDSAVRARRLLAIDVLDCLISIDSRSLYLKEGYSSLFDFCTRRWKQASSTAGRFIAAARCLRKNSCLRAVLERGGLTACGLSRIAGVLTGENRDALLASVEGKPFAEIDRIVAGFGTGPAIGERVRPIGIEKTRESRVSHGKESELFEHSENHPGRSQERPESKARLGSDRTGTEGPACPEKNDTPAETRYEIRFSASGQFLAKLKRARAICSKRATLERVLEKALDELLERHDPERREARRRRREKGRTGNDLVRAAASRDRNGGSPNRALFDGQEGIAPPMGYSSSNAGRAVPARPRSRHIPAALRDAVFQRDGGQCTYVGPGGTRCTARMHLQVDHIRPFCLGGMHELDNLRLLCGKHNRLEAAERIRRTGEKPGSVSTRMK